MEAVILAAGLGKRLKRIFKGPKFSLRISGIPLVYYPILVLMSIGVKKFIVVVAKGFYNLALNIMQNIVKQYGIEVVIIENPYPEKGNGYSFLLAGKNITEKRFFVSMCDHIYSRKIPLNIMETMTEKNADIVVGADSSPKFITVKEATKIYASPEGNVIEIGKNIVKFNFIDLGVFMVERKVLSSLMYLKNKAYVTFSDIIMEAVRKGYKVSVADNKQELWTDIDTPKDLEELLEGKRRIILDTVLREVLEFARKA